MIYHFSSYRREELLDYDTSYCFKSATPTSELFHLNKKATTLIDRGVYIEVHIEDWYLTPKGEFSDNTIKRVQLCEVTHEACKKDLELLKEVK